MTTGYYGIENSTTYEDYTSLKKFVRSQQAIKYKNMRESNFIHNQAGTGSDVEVENKGTETIADIGKTEIAITLTCSADDAYYTGALITLIYLDSDGVSHTCVATGTATLNGTPVVFVPAIADFYCPVSMVSDTATQAGETLTAITSGGADVWATIAAASTTALEAALVGVGSVSANTRVDDATQHGKDVYMSYITPWGALKYGFATLDAANSTTEAVWYEASSAYVATTVLVKDFYRRREFTSEAIAVATKEITIVNIGDTAIYGIIAAGAHFSCHSRYVCPAGRSAWLGRFRTSTSVATKIVTQMTVTWTPYGHTDKHDVIIDLDQVVDQDPLFRLAANTEIKFEIKGNLTDNAFQIFLLEAEDL